MVGVHLKNLLHLKRVLCPTFFNHDCILRPNRSLRRLDRLDYALHQGCGFDAVLLSDVFFADPVDLADAAVLAVYRDVRGDQLPFQVRIVDVLGGLGRDANVCPDADVELKRAAGWQVGKAGELLSGDELRGRMNSFDVVVRRVHVFKLMV